MPLPPAPTRRAALLSPEAYEAPVRRTGAQATAQSLPAAPDTAAQVTPARPPARKAATGTSKVRSIADTARHTPDAPAKARGPAPEVMPIAAKAAPAARPPAPVVAAAPARARKARGTGPAKLFVLDTNVLLHDPTCLFRF
ncbi:hypothetical protein B2J89_21055, partial [Acidovorax sp. SRB_24]|nr:hypothetical protein [Acidovorax sp. SRB_24]